jgi:hypothetical protein
MRIAKTQAVIYSRTFNLFWIEQQRQSFLDRATTSMVSGPIWHPGFNSGIRQIATNLIQLPPEWR